MHRFVVGPVFLLARFGAVPYSEAPWANVQLVTLLLCLLAGGTFLDPCVARDLLHLCGLLRREAGGLVGGPVLDLALLRAVGLRETPATTQGLGDDCSTAHTANRHPTVMPQETVVYWMCTS